MQKEFEKEGEKKEERSWNPLVSISPKPRDRWSFGGRVVGGGDPSGSESLVRQGVIIGLPS